MANLVATLTEPLTAAQWLVVFIGLTIAIVAAGAAGAFRGPLITPQRLREDASTLNLWVAIFAGMAGQVVLPVLMVVPFLKPLATPLTIHQTAVLFPAGSLCGMAALLLAHRWPLVGGPESRWRMSRPLAQGVVPGIVGALVAIPAVVATTFLMQAWWHFWQLPAPDSHALLVAFEQSTSPLDRWLIVLSAVVIAPVFEEMLFRAHLQTAVLQLSRRPWLAVLIASSAFAMAHGSLWMFTPLFLLAVILGAIYERTANLYATIFIHASFNGLMILVAFLTAGK